MISGCRRDDTAGTGVHGHSGFGVTPNVPLGTFAGQASGCCLAFAGEIEVEHLHFDI